MLFHFRILILFGLLMQTPVLAFALITDLKPGPYVVFITGQMDSDYQHNNGHMGIAGGLGFGYGFSAEGEYISTQSDEQVTLIANSDNLNQFAVYITFRFKPNADYRWYGKLKIGVSEFETYLHDHVDPSLLNGLRSPDNTTGHAGRFGMGVGYALTQHIRLESEYTIAADDARKASIGLMWQFF